MKRVFISFLGMLGMLLLTAALGVNHLRFERAVSTLQLQKGRSIEVLLNLHNETFKEEIKLVELLPPNTRAIDVESAGGSVEVIQGKRLVVVWRNVPADSKAVVSYRLFATDELGKNVRINGALYDKEHLVFQSDDTVLNPTAGFQIKPSR